MSGHLAWYMEGLNRSFLDAVVAMVFANMRYLHNCDWFQVL